MRIGLDFDDVVTDFMTPFLFQYNLQHNTSFTLEEKRTFNLWTAQNNSQSNTLKLLEDFSTPENILSLPAIDGAIETLKRLTEEYEITIITGRAKSLYDLTNEWIRRNVGISIPVICTGHQSIESNLKKYALCKEHRLEIMIDDNASTIEECITNGIGGLLFDKPWNKTHPHLDRVSSWEEMYHCLIGVKKGREKYKN